MIEKKISIEGVPHPSHADAVNRVMRDYPEAVDVVVDWDAKEARFFTPDAPPVVVPPVVVAAEEGGHTPSASGAEMLE